MINGKTEQFLDTGWYSESTLFLDGYIYWFEAQIDKNTRIITFFVDKWKAISSENLYYHSLLNSDGSLTWTRIYEVKGTDLDLIKQKFLEAKIFEGKTFWQIEKNISWLEEGDPIFSEI